MGSLCTYRPGDVFRPYGWLVSHTQILHFPMALWYLACRRNAIFSNTRIIQMSRRLFPKLWFSSIGYRFCIMSLSSFQTISGENGLVMVVVASIASLLVYLDFNWTKYFMGELRWPLKSTFEILSLYSFGVIAGLVSFLAT